VIWQLKPLVTHSHFPEIETEDSFILIFINSNNYFMKQFLFWPKGRPGVYSLMYLIMAVVCFTGCRKEPGFHVDFPPSLYSADVIDKWMTL